MASYGHGGAVHALIGCDMCVHLDTVSNQRCLFAPSAKISQSTSNTSYSYQVGSKELHAIGLQRPKIKEALSPQTKFSWSSGALTLVLS